MIEMLLLIGALGAAWSGMALLSLTQAGHRRRLNHLPPLSMSRARIVRATGWGLIVISLSCVIYRDGAAFGVLLWVTLLSVAAVTVALMLSFRPIGLIWIARAIESRQPSRVGGATMTAESRR